MDNQRLVVGQLDTNCYLVSDRADGKTVIIDPGDEADYIGRRLADEGLIPVKILATHGHFDHIMAAWELQINFRIPFLVHQRDEFLVKSLRKRAAYFLGIEVGPPPKINQYLKKGMAVSFGGYKLKVIEVPGHTPGSVAFYEKKEGLLFAGDVIFAKGGRGRTDFKYSDEADLRKSLDKILKMPRRTKIFCGHGPETTVEKERPHFTSPGKAGLV